MSQDPCRGARMRSGSRPGRRNFAAALLAASVGTLVPIGETAAAADKPYFQEFRSENCAAAASCALDFPKVKKDKLARLSNVSCLVTLSSQLKSLQMEIVGRAFVVATVTLKPFAMSGSSEIFVSNDKIAAFVEAGEFVRVRVQTDPGGAAPKAPGDGDGSIDLSCHVAGSY